MHKRPLRILVVDNSIQAIDRFCSELRKGGFIPDYLQVENFEQFSAALKYSWQLILSEYSFANYDCLEALMYCRKKRINIPFFVVSDIVSEDSIVKSIKSGACDFIVKENLHRLVPAVRRELSRRDAYPVIETKLDNAYLEEMYPENPQPLVSQTRFSSPQTKATDMSVLLQDTVEIIKPMLPTQVDIILKNNVKNLSVEIEQKHFQEILISLCVNSKSNITSQGCIAIEVTQVNNHKVTCSVCEKKAKGNYYMISIVDCCYRVSSDYFRKLAKKHHPQWNKENLSDIKTVSELIHQYNGHLIMDPGGENTSYHILFPNSSSEKSTHILVVDDDFSSTHFMSQVFKTKGFRVTPICDSTAALQHFKKNADRYDLAFIDFFMPGLNGAELAGALLKIKPDLAVVLCTAHLNIDETETKSLGISAVIYKPMRIKQMLELTECLLLSKHLKGGAIEQAPSKERH